VAGAIERGRVAREAWTSDGTLLSAAEYAARRGVSTAELLKLETRGELFSLDIAGSRWYASGLLQLPPDVASLLCHALAGDNEAKQLIFLMRTHGALAGQTPAEAIAQGKLSEVVKLAHVWRER
jgi:hypothetical protein